MYVLIQTSFSNSARVVSYRVVSEPAEVVSAVEGAGCLCSYREVARAVADYGKVYSKGGLGEVSTDLGRVGHWVRLGDQLGWVVEFRL
jgi:hypothetical protein